MMPGVSLSMVEAFAGRVPILGVCLGHQSIIQQHGGRIVRAERLMHGKTSMVKHDGESIFAGLSNPFEVGRYHSLCAEEETLPEDLIVTAQTDRGEIMGVRHKTLPIEGVQFHPESVLTSEGDRSYGQLHAPGGPVSREYNKLLDSLLDGRVACGSRRPTT